MAAHPIEVIDNQAQQPFVNFGEQLHAIVRAASSYPGRVTDPRLFELNRRAAAAGGSETVPSDGGFLVAPEFSRELVRRMYMTGDILGRCFPMPIARGNSIAFPKFSESSRVDGSRLGGVEALWENEAAALVPTKPAFSLSTLTAKKITCLIYVTDELTRDSDALNAWANLAFAQEGTFKLESAIVNGTGAGQPLGVLKSTALVTVAAEGAQVSGTIVNNNVVKMLASLWAPSRRNAIWIYNQAQLPQLANFVQTVGTGGSQSNTFRFATMDGEPDRLAGIAAYPSEYCQVPGVVGDLILADFSRYVVAMRERRTDVSMHVNFLTDENVFKLVIRVDGQPIDQVAVTPAFGSTKTSPFVTLAARP